MTEEAKEKQRQYYREWRKKNPDKIRENNRRYWEKKAAKARSDQNVESKEAK